MILTLMRNKGNNCKEEVVTEAQPIQHWLCDQVFGLLCTGLQGTELDCKLWASVLLPQPSRTVS